MDELSPNSVYFKWSDYILITVMMLGSLAIGIYYGYFAKHQSVDQYLRGSRNMNLIPIVMSMCASIISGISFIAIPAEIFKFGITTFLTPIILQFSICFMSFYIYPVLYNLNLTSIYEYMELRFDKRVRLLTSFLYAMSMLCFLTISIYAPALIISRGTSINVHYLSVTITTICVFYTSVGGLKAVIWTDALQLLFMVGTIIGIIVMGFTDVGFAEVFSAAYKSGRLDIDFDPDPTKRDTFWTISLGFTLYWTQYLMTSQHCIQKAFCLSDVKKMQKAMTIFGVVYFLFIEFLTLFGLIVYAKFQHCDPVRSGEIHVHDQIAIHYILHVTENLPGIAGLFIVGNCSASISSLSAGLNSLSCTIYKDFVSSFLKANELEKRSSVIIKSIVISIGILLIALVVVVEKAGSIMSSLIGIGSLFAGPMMGLFLLGMFTVKAKAKGAFYGVVITLGILIWIFAGAQYYQQLGYIRFKQKELLIDGCEIITNTTEQIRLPEFLIAGTKLNVHYFTIFFSVICIFYTTIGGLKTVIWTDVLQMIFIIFTSIGFVYLGLQRSGGIQKVLNYSYQGGRSTIDFDLDPTKRDTFWTISFGASTYWIQYLLTNQAFMQKTFCSQNIKLMRIAMIMFSLGYFIMISLFIFFGLIIYEEFKDCDPFRSGKIKVLDQISMHYILHVTKEIPAIAGLFIVAIFSASFSSFSAYLNAVSCTIYKDFLFNLIREGASEKFRKPLVQLIVVLVGTVGTLLVLVIENARSLLATIIGIGALSGGPMLGVFILALFSTKANSRGALFGAVTSFVIVLWMFLGAKYYQQNGYITIKTKPLSVEGCDFFQNKTSPIEISQENQFTPLFIYRISHNYYTIIGTIITIVTGLVISYIPGGDMKIPRKEYLSPLVHWLLPKETNKYKEVALKNLSKSSE
ncbi:PREDICTED: sodium-coupled monocarboxylate transporter 1-like [Nicrophorus vespilloides]|uniref:Sodium-coupled monocarboxylate transporter 1-like n=1 Tax=Nicrophorus vespilloides TaxID=110193 RepID=A0ABM1ME36_NICVS|nr:PREDICTED: sodium-coupled monocarboxylate transporter 1-like [Nicrophorus vespilloides]